MCGMKLSLFHARFVWDLCMGAVLVLSINRTFSNRRIFLRPPRG